MTIDDDESVIRALAAAQQGVVTRAQLLAAGVSGHSVDYRVKRGRLRRLLRGVYRAGPLPSRYERQMAAVLACGGGAVLSHRSAGALWRLLPVQPEATRIDVTVEGRYRLRGSRVALAHRTAELSSDDRTHLEGIPITTPARTLLDLTLLLPIRRVERALDRGLRRALVSPEDLEKFLQRFPRRPGTRLLLDLVARERDVGSTRSEAEARFLALVERARLPRPHTNVTLHGHEVDFLWRRERMVVEVDGFQYHQSAKAFERDRRRDALLAAEGVQVIRVTWRQLVEEPEALLVRIARALLRAEKR